MNPVFHVDAGHGVRSAKFDSHQEEEYTRHSNGLTVSEESYTISLRVELLFTMSFDLLNKVRSFDGVTYDYGILNVDEVIVP